MDVELDLIEESYGTFQHFNIDIPKEDADMVYGLRYAFQNMLSTVSFIDIREIKQVIFFTCFRRIRYK